MQREKTPEWWGKTERLTWHKARTGVSLSFSISYTSSHRRLFQKDGIGLSQTGKATQLVIMSHGGWKEISHP
ncbi:hypothetical protein ACVOC2_21335, partial [Shigella sonnei]